MSKTIRCQFCGGGIGKARLDALPDTDRCVRCAARHETPDMMQRFVTVYASSIDDPDFYREADPEDGPWNGWRELDRLNRRLM